MPIRSPAPLSLPARLAGAGSTILAIGLIAACGPGPAPATTTVLATQATRSTAEVATNKPVTATGAPVTGAVEATQASVADPGLPEGTYGCWNYQPYVGFGAYWGELDVTGPDAYVHAGVGSGGYRVAGKDVTFTSGDLTAYRGEYPVNGDDIDLIGIGDMDGVYVRCSIPEG